MTFQPSGFLSLGLLDGGRSFTLVVVAEHLGQFPGALVHYPHVRKLRSAGPEVFFVFLADVKIVHTSLYGAVQFPLGIQGKNFQTLRSYFPDGFFVSRTADIVCGAFQEFGFVLKATLVMVKTKVIGYLMFQIVKVAAVKSPFEENAVLDL